MSDPQPGRVEEIEGKLIEEVHVSGSVVVYVNRRLVNGTYEEVVQKVKNGEPITWID